MSFFIFRRFMNLVEVLNLGPYKVSCSYITFNLVCRSVKVETNNNHTRKDIYNVIGILKGAQEPG